MASRTSARSSSSVIPRLLFLQIHRVHDAEDGGVHGRQFLAERLTGGASFEYGDHQLTAPGADRVNGQQRCAAFGAGGRFRLQDQELGAFELRALLRRHDLTDYAGEDPAYRPARRALRSWGELAAVQLDRPVFFAADGSPTAAYRVFRDDFSLHAFNLPNLNTAPPSVLLTLGLGAPTEQDVIADAAAVRGWVDAWRACDGLGSVVWEERKWARLGSQQLPAMLMVATPLEVAAARHSASSTWR